MAGGSRTSSTSSSSESTRMSRPASRAERACGPSPRSSCSSSAPAARPRRPQRAVDGDERGAEVILALQHLGGEAQLGLAPRQRGEARTGAQRPVTGGAGGRVERDDVRVGQRGGWVCLELAVAGEREAADALAQARQPPGDIRAQRQHRTAAGDRIDEHREGAVTAAVEHRAGVAHRRRRRRPPRGRPIEHHVELGQHRLQIRRARQPRSSIAAGAQGWAWRSTSRGSTAPFHAFAPA